MNSGKIFCCSERKQWREWLSEHFEKETEIWFVFPTKDSGEPGLSYNDAVEEALCFGWIDSTNRRLDEQHCIRRFSPRKAGSPYSQPNIERLIWLHAHGFIHPKIEESILPVIHAQFVFPQDIIDVLRQDKTVWENASRLMADSKVTARVKELRNELAKPTIMSAQKRLEWLTEVIRNEEEKTENRLKAADIMNKMQGEYVQKVQAEVQTETTIHIELVDDDEC